MRHLSSVFLILTLSYASTGITQELPVIKTKMEVERNEDNLTIKPVVQNQGSLYLSYDYVLLVKKTDAQNNLSINNQGGKFTLEPGEVKTLSLLQISTVGKDRIRAYLYIRDEEKNQLITKDSLELGLQNNAMIEEKALMNITGVVVDESKTKIGHDFYDLFYSIYNQYPNKFDFIITISELPYRGLTSKIQVNVQQNTVYEFIGNPDEEYTKQQVSMSLNRLVEYARQNPNISSY